MKLKKLEFSNFLRFGPKTIFDFPDKFNIVITGRWQNQSERSNRTGKSSFVEAIKFLYYGKTRGRFVKEIPNDNYNEDAIVKGQIEIDGEEFDIERIVSGSSSSLKVKQWSKSNLDKDETQKKLNELFGYDYKDFVKTCYFEQGEIAQFMESGSSEKLDLLIRWLDILNWMEYFEVVKERKKEIKKDIERNLLNIENLKENKEELEIKKKLLQRTKRTIEKVEEEKREKEKELNILKEKLIEAEKDFKSLVNEREEVDDELMSQRKISILKTDKKEIEVKIKNYKREIEEAKERIKSQDKLIKEISKIRIKIEGLSEEINTYRFEIEKLDLILEMNIKGGSCPIDKKKCVRPQQIKKEMQKAKDKKEILKSSKESALEKQKGLQGEVSSFELESQEIAQSTIRSKELKYKIENSETEKKMIQNKIDTRESQEKRIEELDKKIDKIKKSIKDKPKIEKKVELLEDSIENNNSLISKMQYTKGSASSEIKQLKEVIERGDESKLKLKILYSDEQICNFMFMMFGPNGIRARQLKGRVKEIELETNQILEELESGMQIKIELERELGTWESSCLICGRDFIKGTTKHECKNCGSLREKRKRQELEILIIEDGKSKGFNQESGGAKVLVSLAIRLSIIKLRQRIIGKSAGLLILDEIYGMLDKSNRRFVYQFLIGYAQRNLGFHQVFQITHIDVGYTGENNIEVIRKEKHSIARWAK